MIQPDPSLAVEVLEGVRPSQPVFEEATRLRDEGKGRVVTYSRKVFIPLTTLCRDRCSYCTFAKPPGDGGMYLEPEEALAVARAGEERQCTEALLTLGDRPEHRWPEARRFLASHGCRSTLDYVGQISELINRETALFPHANPGVMGDEAIGRLRSSNVSMGLMLENVSLRLMEPGMPHHGCPDKHPALRVSTIEAAGRRRVPFTTGLLVGIGENAREIVDSLVALGELQARWRCIQEVIIQNFRAKDDTRMRWHAEPVPFWFARVVAVARWLLGPEVNLQVPPNLTQRYEIFLAAGINDWGGVSPLTIDWVNPEQPWPHLEDLRHRTEAAGYRLKPRLPVYPEFITPEWIEPRLMDKVRRAVDEQGYARAPQMEVSVG